MTLAPALAASVVRLIGCTLRLTVTGDEALRPLWSSRQPLIYAMWHGRVLMIPWLNARLCRSDGAQAARVLISRSRDGDIVARFVQHFGLGVVRGSSSRSGMAAARALAAALRAHEDIAMIPDGPRGPRGQAQPGLVTLAALTGALIVPLAFAARPAWRLRTWDEFLIPAPFAKAAAVFGEPLLVARADDRGRALKNVQQALTAVTAAADRLVVP